MQRYQQPARHGNFNCIEHAVCVFFRFVGSGYPGRYFRWWIGYAAK